MQWQACRFRKNTLGPGFGEVWPGWRGGGVRSNQSTPLATGMWLCYDIRKLMLWHTRMIMANTDYHGLHLPDYLYGPFKSHAGLPIRTVTVLTNHTNSSQSWIWQVSCKPTRGPRLTYRNLFPPRILFPTKPSTIGAPRWLISEKSYNFFSKPAGDSNRQSAQSIAPPEFQIPSKSGWSTVHIHHATEQLSRHYYTAASWNV